MSERIAATLARWLTAPQGTERALFAEARRVTERTFGRRIQLFAPLYISNLCVNSCLYCGFRRENRIRRRALRPDGVAAQARALVAAGHRTGLLVAGEHQTAAGPSAVAAAIHAAREAGLAEVLVEVMPMTMAGYRQLVAAGADGVLLYQETYDRILYALAHPHGPKAAYEWRRYAPDRALGAGMRRFGLGMLVGLGEAAADAAALILHARELYRRWGVWPTISLPRLQPAAGAPWAERPPHPVDDQSFLRLFALLRLALPECGMVCSTREPALLRRRLLELGLGVTHLSAGASTMVGGYTQTGGATQFAIQDDRTAEEVVEELQRLGYTPHWSDIETAEATA